MVTPVVFVAAVTSYFVVWPAREAVIYADSHHDDARLARGPSWYLFIVESVWRYPLETEIRVDSMRFSCVFTGSQLDFHQQFGGSKEFADSMAAYITGTMDTFQRQYPELPVGKSVEWLIAHPPDQISLKLLPPKQRKGGIIISPRMRFAQSTRIVVHDRVFYLTKSYQGSKMVRRQFRSFKGRRKHAAKP